MRRLLLVALAAVAFVVGYGAVSQAWPIKDRQPYRGYFTNDYDTSGDNVWNPGQGPSSCRGSSSLALPSWVNSKNEFISFVKCKLNNGNSQERVGAQFIIQTMRGKDNGKPSSSEIADWEDRIRNPAVNVNWSTNRSYTVNSFYQGCCGGGSNPVDDAFFPENGSGSSVVFSVPGHDYVLRRQCANPVGNGEIGTLPPAPPSLNFDIDGRTTISDTTVLPGQNVTWEHFLDNEDGPTGTSPTTINWRVYNTLTGGQTLNGNAGTFADGQEKMVRRHTLTIPANANPGDRFCRHIWFSPENENGGSDQGSPACATVQYSFQLTPSVNAVISSGGSPITGNVAEPGDTITFTYAVNNSGLTESQTITCTYRQAAHTGYNESPPGSVFVPPGANCPPPRTFPRNSNTTTAIETVLATTANTTICKSITVNPATQSGGSAEDQACVLVAAKPYARVWGGDISAGNGLADISGVCSQNNEASVVSWNRRQGANYAGAGAQFAVYALNRITDFSSALYDPGGADVPTGLSFANTASNPNNGHFGGSLGSVPCIPNYYVDRPSSGATVLAPSVNLSSLGSGTYVRNGPLTLGAGGGVMNVNPGESITIYVDGDVRIANSIAYPGSWNVGNMPMFRLVVQGNIYIENSVSELSGVYIAQANSSGNGGQIHTCAAGFGAVPLSGAVYSTCNQRLTINGAFVADQVRLLRTNGTLAQSLDSESNTSGSVAEIFNFGPGVWIPQPPGGSGEPSPDYDAIISLPPVL